MSPEIAASEPLLLGLDHVQIAAPPGFTAQGRAYFGALLGLAELPRPASMAAREGLWFALGEQQLHLGAEADFRPAKKAHPALRARDARTVRALSQRLCEAGYPTTFATDAPGAVRFHVSDPWGNRLEFTAPDDAG